MPCRRCASGPVVQVLSKAWRRRMALSKPIRHVESKLGLTVDARCNGPAVRRGGNAPCPAEAGDHELTWLDLSVLPVAWISVVGIIQHSQRNLTTQAGDCNDPKGEAEMVCRLLFSIELDATARWWWNINVDSCDVLELVDSVARQRFGWRRSRSHNKFVRRNWPDCGSHEPRTRASRVEINQGGGRYGVWWMLSTAWLGVPHQLLARCLTVRL